MWEANLIQWLCEVIPCLNPPEGQSELRINHLDLLPHYPALKSSLVMKEKGKLRDFGTIGDDLLDLRLFTRDFLLERSIFESFGFESLYEDRVLTATHWQEYNIALSTKISTTSRSVSV